MIKAAVKFVVDHNTTILKVGGFVVTTIGSGMMAIGKDKEQKVELAKNVAEFVKNNR